MDQQAFQVAFLQATSDLENYLTGLVDLYDNAPSEEVQLAMSAHVTAIFSELRAMDKHVKGALRRKR